jgi:MFS transporter, PPP family, 3-phenylpropionic acid transporter
MGAKTLGSFPALAVLSAALYAAYGMESPYLPAFLGERGLSAGDIGLVLAAGTLARIAAGPFAGHLADRLDAPRAVLAVAALGAAALSFAYLAGAGLGTFLAISVAHACAIAPLAPLVDALTLAAAGREGGFAYGWVRGVGSGAFIAGTLASGLVIAHAGLASIIVGSGLLFALVALAVPRVPAAPVPAEPDAGVGPGDLRTLLALPAFRSIAAAAALIIGSHALHDAFAVIRWREAGLSASTISLLWSEAVAAEILVFLVAGPRLVARLGPAGSLALASLAGAGRWAVMALTTAVPALALAQLAHGLTFALVQLAAMDVIARTVPARFGARAQTLYGTAGLGLSSAVLTALSGLLYGQLQGRAFWLMAALCLTALPFARHLRARA